MQFQSGSATCAGVRSHPPWNTPLALSCSPSCFPRQVLPLRNPPRLPLPPSYLCAPQIGDSVMVLPTIPEEEAKKLFPKGVFTKELPSGKKYLRYTPQP